MLIPDTDPSLSNIGGVIEFHAGRFTASPNTIGETFGEMYCI